MTSRAAVRRYLAKIAVQHSRAFAITFSARCAEASSPRNDPFDPLIQSIVTNLRLRGEPNAACADVPRKWRGSIVSRCYLSDTRPHHTYFSIVARASCVRSPVCDGASLAPVIRRVIQSIDRNVAVSEVQTMTHLVDSVTANTRFYLLLLGAFAGIALTLAALGIYGVMHYTVTLRTQEIGIRLALGPDATRVVGLVVRQALTVTGVGVGAGAIVALALTRLMSTLLYGVRASDVWTFAVTALVLVAVATIASALPARRATRIDPLSALRAE
jgi:ABC-type antimicrobial peptide transport system permease subunit